MPAPAPVTNATRRAHGCPPAHDGAGPRHAGPEAAQQHEVAVVGFGLGQRQRDRRGRRVAVLVDVADRRLPRWMPKRSMIASMIRVFAWWGTNTSMSSAAVTPARSIAFVGRLDARAHGTAEHLFAVHVHELLARRRCPGSLQPIRHTPNQSPTRRSPAPTARERRRRRRRRRGSACRGRRGRRWSTASRRPRSTRRGRRPDCTSASAITSA